MIWLISDTHFWHTRILTYCPGRRFTSIEAMNEAYIERWNSVVKSSDVVWHLGDFAMCNATNMKALIKRLAGSKNLIMGNHDRKSAQWYMNNGFEWAGTETVAMYLDGQYFTMSHYPLRLNWMERLRMLFTEPKRLRHLKHMPENIGQFHVCGHVHNRWRSQRKTLNVGVDMWNGYPVSEEEIIKFTQYGLKGESI